MSTELRETKSPETQPQRPPRQRTAAKVLRRTAIVLLVGGLPLLMVFLVFVGMVGWMFTASDGLLERPVNTRLWNGKGAKIAVIRLEGTILTGDGYIKQQIEQVMKDREVKAVVLRINSPGGLVSGSDFIYHQLKEMRTSRGDGQKLPMVVSMGGLAASGGYYAAMAVEDTPDSLYAEPSTWTGSIGVIIPHYNFADLLKEHGIQEDSIKSHRLKGMGSLGRRMTEEEQKIFQELVDAFYNQFKDVVQRGRPEISREQIDRVATGQVYTTQQALANGLVDKEGYLEDAIRGVIAMLGVSESEVRVVEYQKPVALIDLFLAQSKQPSLDMTVLLDMTRPQAYYHFTWVPGALR